MSVHTITVTQKAYSKMMLFARHAKGEISGFGRIDPKQSKPLVLDVRIADQVCSGGYTEITEKGFDDFLNELIAHKMDPSEWNCWWHSHNTFGCFISGTDQDNIERLTRTTGQTWYHIWVNKAYEHMVVVSYIDSLGNVVVKHGRLAIIPHQPGELVGKICRAIKRCVHAYGGLNTEG